MSMPQKKVSKGYPPLKGHWWNITCGKSQFRSLIGARSLRGTCPWPLSSITQNIWGETVLKEEEEEGKNRSFLLPTELKTGLAQSRWREKGYCLAIEVLN